MQYLNSRLLCIWIVCLSILLDQTHSLRVRSPVLRLSSTIRKTAAFIKKKLHMDKIKLGFPNERSTLEDDPPETNDEF